jgi:hypothetical protein
MDRCNDQAVGPAEPPGHDLVAGTIAPPVARAQVLHLLWHRRLSIDLALPLADPAIPLMGPAGPAPPLR